MLGTSQRHFPKRQIPKGIFLSGNFPNVQFPKRQIPKSVLAAVLVLYHVLVAALGPLSHTTRSARPPYPPLHCSLRRFRGPNLTLGKLHIWEVATWEVSLG